jgi:hypothetical protein
VKLNKTRTSCNNGEALDPTRADQTKNSSNSEDSRKKHSSNQPGEISSRIKQLQPTIYQTKKIPFDGGA